MFIGYFPVASGSVGSLVMVGVLWYMRESPIFSPENTLLFWITGVVITALSLVFSSKSQELYGDPDSSKIVIDEAAGQFITFFFVPLTARNLVLGFFLFRFFDIIKPWPVHKLEEIEDGTGVTMDDVAAGVMANICLLIVRDLFNAFSGYIS